MPAIKKDFSITKGIQVQGSIKLGSNTVTSVVDSATVTQIVEDSSVASSITSAGGLIATTYDSADLLPLSGNKAGDFGFVSETNRLYLWNGIGWYNIALVNTTPTFNSLPNSSYVLDSNAGIATTITLNATDPEEVPITYSYVASDSASNFATISQSDNVITVTSLPKATVWANVGPGDSGGGTFTITFKASDGINIVPAVSSFTLTIDLANAYSTSTESPLTFTQSPSMTSILGNGKYDGAIGVNYAGDAVVIGCPTGNPVPGNTSYNNDGGLSFLYKKSGSWIRTANGTHTNFDFSSNAPDGRWGDTVTISADGKRAISSTRSWRNTAKHGTWYRYYYDYVSNSPSDGSDVGSLNFTDFSFSSTQLTDNTPGFRSPMVKVNGAQYSYGLWAVPTTKRGSTSNVGNLQIIKCDENSSSHGFTQSYKEFQTSANYYNGYCAGAINHQGDRLVSIAYSKIDYATGTAGNMSTNVTTNTLTSIGGISASSLRSGGGQMRFDVNRKLYLTNGAKIVIFDLSNGSSSDFNSYDEIVLSTLIPTNTDGTTITWAYNQTKDMSVSYNGDYILLFNDSVDGLFQLYNNDGTWELANEIYAPSGAFNRCAMSGDASTIVARTNYSAYIYEAT